MFGYHRPQTATLLCKNSHLSGCTSRLFSHPDQNVSLFYFCSQPEAVP
jgi:hypothetical protein